MRLEAYVIFMFSFTVVAYFFGYQSPLLSVFTSQGGVPLAPVDILGHFATSFMNDLTLATIISVTITGLVASLMGGFSITFLIPLLLAASILNWVVFPIQEVVSQTTEPMIQIPLLVFINLFTIFALLDFVRGKT